MALPPSAALTIFFFFFFLVCSLPGCKFIQCPTLALSRPSRTASSDFGNTVSLPPRAVLRPFTAEDIARLLAGAATTVAARGAGHSLHGQAQALDGVVVEMRALRAGIEVFKNAASGGGYADVGGGVLWSELLAEGLKHGLAPRSWTDYLDITVGGTLSNGGISGQTFKHGPQISNVLQLEVVTGRGEVVTCSPAKNAELFHAVLGGLGQFGIITKARIILQDAPQKVRWVRAFYDDFHSFITDQEMLISMPESLDYVEGFLVLNQQSLHSSSIAFPAQVNFHPEFFADDGEYRVYYCLEFAVHIPTMEEKVVDFITRSMSYIPSQMYSVEVSYFDFLSRVRMEELSLRARGLWDVPHPWLNMFVPKSGITEFRDLLLSSISPPDFEGPVLLYPILKDKWDSNTSMVIPGGKERVMYTVGVLRSTDPAHCSQDCLDEILAGNRRVADAASKPNIGAKQYLGHHGTPARWRDHFGQGWERLVARKAQFDPMHILAPGQGIFPRAAPSADV